MSTAQSTAVRLGENVLRGIRSAVDPLTTHAGDTSQGGAWLAVTVAVEPDAVDADRLPAPLAEYGDRIQVRTRPAPGDKGTELHARLRESSSSSTASSLSGSDEQAGLRSALRRAKQLIEVGEVLAVDPVPHGERPSTPGGLLLEAWTRVAPAGGVR